MAMLLSKKVYRELMFLFVVYSKLHHMASWENCKNGMVFFPCQYYHMWYKLRPLLKILKVLVGNHMLRKHPHSFFNNFSIYGNFLPKAFILTTALAISCNFLTGIFKSSIIAFAAGSLPIESKGKGCFIYYFYFIKASRLHSP